MEAENVIGRRYGLQQAYVVHINKYITASIDHHIIPAACHHCHQKLVHIIGSFRHNMRQSATLAPGAMQR